MNIAVVIAKREDCNNACGTMQVLGAVHVTEVPGGHLYHVNHKCSRCGFTRTDSVIQANLEVDDYRTGGSPRLPEVPRTDELQHAADMLEYGEGGGRARTNLKVAAFLRSLMIMTK